MARKVFISFRFSDGHLYKEELVKKFNNYDDVINCSENVDRSKMSEETIKKYLYKKLSNTSVTIVLLTPQAIYHQKDYFGNIDDWIYDEIRYSLEDRENNRCNGLIAVYTPEAEKILIDKRQDSIIINDFDNLVRKNMFNIKDKFKHCPTPNRYNPDLDHYCSLVSWKDFISNPNYYIEKAVYKRDHKEQYNMTIRIQNNNRYW